MVGPSNLFTLSVTVVIPPAPPPPAPVVEPTPTVEPSPVVEPPDPWTLPFQINWTEDILQ